MEKVKNTALQQKGDPKFNPEGIYGVCVVEKLDTNIIFKRDKIYFRGSSARWQRHPYSHFEGVYSAGSGSILLADFKETQAKVTNSTFLNNYAILGGVFYA